MRSNNTTWMRGLAWIATLAAFALSAGSAAASTVHGNWIATDYVTGFPQPPSADEAGPIGLAFDSSANLLITDINTGTFHRVPPGGGTTAAQTLVTTGLGKPAGLAFGADGRLYMARADQARVDEINPANASVVRTVASGLACPTGLAVDPLSGDLFASNKCGSAPINRIGSPASTKPTVKTYSSRRADGLTFQPDGTLFAAVDDSEVDSIAGTNQSDAGTATKVADVADIDGIAYSPATSNHAAYLVVNRTNGEIDMLDLQGHSTPIVTGASRGDLVTVGPDHCIYADLQDRVIKLAPSQGSCDFATPVQQVLGTRSTARVIDTAVSAKASKTVRRGSRFTVTLKVTNKSKNVAHKVVLTDALPRGTKFVSARSIKGVACKAKRRRLTCRLASLRARKSFTVKVVERSKSGSRYTNAAKVASADLDPAPGNNHSSARTKVKAANNVLGVQRHGKRLPSTTG